MVNLSPIRPRNVRYSKEVIQRIIWPIGGKSQTQTVNKINKMNDYKSASLFFEMLRSFTTLADELNLSRTVERLNSTRQTVRRHIATLEEMRGEPLFYLDDRRYRLTPAGRSALDEALDIVARSEAWINNQTGHVSGLQHIKSGDVGTLNYNLQQHPLSKLWQSGPPLMQDTVKAWAASSGQIENEQFQEIRPNVIVFRQFGDGWICVEVGEYSSYSTWFGWEWARSSIGLGSAELPGGRGFGRLLVKPFDQVHRDASMRYDHIVTELPREKGGPMVPISYQRLLLGCRFPDNSAGIISMVVRTWDIEIQGVTADAIQRMPKSLCMDVD